MDYHSASAMLFSFMAILPAVTGVLLFIAFLLFLVSFMIAGAEVAFFSLTEKDVRVLNAREDPSLRRVVVLLEQPKTLLASMLITNSLANIGIILISNFVIDDWLPDAMTFWPRFLIKVLSVAFMLLLFAEVLPKVWATHHRIRFASHSSLVVEIANGIFYRLSKRLVRFSDRIEKRFSSEKDKRTEAGNIDHAIDLLPENEATTEEKQILKGIQKFSDTPVKQIMRARLDVSGIEESTGFRDLIRRVEELHYSRLPVYKGNLDEIAGILHTKDLLPHINESGDFQWHSFLRKPFFIHETKLIEDLLQEFRAKRIHFAVVVDEFGGTSGIVTLEDIMEEIIGEIKDEFDEEDSGNKKIDENTFVFEGRYMINDACRLMKLPAETFDKVRGESDSMAGLVLEIAGEFPQVGEELKSGDFAFVPTEMSKNRIDKVKVTITPRYDDNNLSP